MIGTILAGGQSSRMGLDKGLMELNGRIWTKVVQEKLISLSLPTVVSIRQEQLDPYAKHFKQHDLIIDNPALKIHGPLAGLMSVHLLSRENNILLIACDMINMEVIAIKKLLEEFHERQPEAIAFKGQYIEPLCAAYSAVGLKKIFSSYSQQALKKHSMRHVLEKLETIYLPIEEEWKPFFKNFNEMSDLDS
jgi:molybdopterin-guanine dinucleotide biosynthesis protein A